MVILPFCAYLKRFSWLSSALPGQLKHRPQHHTTRKIRRGDNTAVGRECDVIGTVRQLDRSERLAGRDFPKDEMSWQVHAVRINTSCCQEPAIRGETEGPNGLRSHVFETSDQLPSLRVPYVDVPIQVSC